FPDPATPLGFYFGFDSETLFLRVDAPDGFPAPSALGFYMNLPVEGPANAYSRYGRDATLLGFGARRLLEITFETGRPVARAYAADGSGNWDPVDGAAGAPRAALEGELLEVAAPLASLAPSLGGGDRIHLRLIVSEDQSDTATLPTSGPALLVTPDLPLPNVVLAVDDPAGDDHGPGSYTYPTDGVFVPGVFDLTRLLVGSDEENVIFRLTIDGPINNHWGSPNGLSAQTLDIYVDVNGPGSGDRILLPGRNAALTPGFAWDFAVWVEGWTPGIFRPSPDGPVPVDADLEIVTNPGQRRVTITVPRWALPGDPATWSIAVVMLGQEGFPAAGVWRVRDVNPSAEQWRFGGAPTDAHHTRIIDFLWPEGSEPTQEQLLGNYPATSEAVDSLDADDLPQVPMITVAEVD
ncbi:MAG: glucodextranase DOMON-like domain-containing protein, partial [Anaerolineales bacterium]